MERFIYMHILLGMIGHDILKMLIALSSQPEFLAVGENIPFHLLRLPRADFGQNFVQDLVQLLLIERSQVFLECRAT